MMFLFNTNTKILQVLIALILFSCSNLKHRYISEILHEYKNLYEKSYKKIANKIIFQKKYSNKEAKMIHEKYRFHANKRYNNFEKFLSNEFTERELKDVIKHDNNLKKITKILSKRKNSTNQLGFMRNLKKFDRNKQSLEMWTRENCDRDKLSSFRLDLVSIIFKNSGLQEFFLKRSENSEESMFPMVQGYCNVENKMLKELKTIYVNAAYSKYLKFSIDDSRKSISSNLK